LIEKHVSLQQIKTAQINSDWGCLEFNKGMVDIEAKTLYNYVYGIHHQGINHGKINPRTARSLY
jgi:hypothetical protein